MNLRLSAFRLLSSIGLLSSAALPIAGCFPENPGIEGSCEVVSEAELDCRVEGYEPGVLLDAGLVAYSCSGEARPDFEATYDEGFPKGPVCANKGLLADETEGFCCTEQPVDCAYLPVSDCDENWDAFECRGTNRPESLNAAITCGNGIRRGELTEYCCSGVPEAPLCSLSDVVPCQGGLLGFTCKEGGHPRGEQLGANKSRPDHYNFTCTTPEPAPNPEYETTCCFAPPLVLEGGSCVNHTAVPDCGPGRFGFACYGPDTPEDDYLAMDCPEPGFEGMSNEGYPATLYCCDFK